MLYLFFDASEIMHQCTNTYFLRKLLVNAMLLFLVGPLGKPAVEWIYITFTSVFR